MKTMIKTTYNFNIKIINEKYGQLLSENFVDQTQFKIFLKMVHGALELKEDLSFFDGNTFLIHIPYSFLKNSMVLTSTFEISLTEQVKNKLETLVD